MKTSYINIKEPLLWAFNIWDSQSAQAVLDGAIACGKNVILQTSMKSFNTLDRENLRYIVTKSNKKQKVQAFLHLDHCTKIEMVEEAINLGWDSVMIDASGKALAENISITNEVTDCAHKKDVLVEAEVGKIQGVEEEMQAKEAPIAQIEDVIKFVKETSVDMLAIAIGTAHGVYRGEPHLHYDLIDKVKKVTQIPLVIHGGSGLSDEMFMTLMEYENVKKINISTDVKLAYRDAIRKSYAEKMYDTDDFDPLLINKYIHDEIKNMVIHKLEL